MDKKKAKLLIGELVGLVGDSPHENDSALARCREIAFQFGSDLGGNVRFAMDQVADDMSYWFSQRKWAKRAGSQERMRAMLMTSISRLDMAIDLFFRGAEDPAVASNE